MHIFVDTWMCHCFRCAYHASTKKALESLGVSDIPRESLASVGQKIRSKISHPKESIVCDPPEVSLPDNTTFNWFSDAIPFQSPQRQCEKWKISPDTCKEMKWAFCMTSRRFVFPSFMEGKIVYYSERGLGSSGIRKNMQGDFAQYGILYNWDDPLQFEVKDCYVVEGPKDAAAMHQRGYWAVALLSHVLNDAQIIRLKTLPHNLKILLDSDVSKTSISLERKGFETLYLPEEDPAEFVDSLPDVLSNSKGLSAKVKQIVKNRQTT